MKITVTKTFIVVPWDFSEMSSRALRKVVEMVGDSSLIQVIHVGFVAPPYEYGIEWEAISEEIAAEKIEESFRNSIKDCPELEGVAFTVAFGDAGKQICDFAKSTGAEGIVMPSHGYSGFSRVLLGSVAERVVRFASCPVLVLRCEENANPVTD